MFTPIVVHPFFENEIPRLGLVKMYHPAHKIYKEIIVEYIIYLFINNKWMKSNINTEALVKIINCITNPIIITTSILNAFIINCILHHYNLNNTINFILLSTITHSSTKSIKKTNIM